MLRPRRSPGCPAAGIGRTDRATVAESCSGGQADSAAPGGAGPAGPRITVELRRTVTPPPPGPPGRPGPAILRYLPHRTRGPGPPRAAAESRGTVTLGTVVNRNDLGRAG
eukprot:763780-Hanusia_phi.AAC.1